MWSPKPFPECCENCDSPRNYKRWGISIACRAFAFIPKKGKKCHDWRKSKEVITKPLKTE